MTMAGYSGTPLGKKLGIKDDSRVLAIGAPIDYAFATVTKAPADIVHLFVTSLAELDKQVPRAQGDDHRWRALGQLVQEGREDPDRCQRGSDPR